MSGAAIGDEVDRVARLRRRSVRRSVAASLWNTSHAPTRPRAAGDDAAADAVALLCGVSEDAFDVQRAGGRRDPAANRLRAPRRPGGRRWR